MHVYTRVNELEGVIPIGDGECVALVQKYSDVGTTHAWRAGPRVVETGPLWPGTAIATFVKGRYLQYGKGNRHAAFFLGYGPSMMSDGLPNGIWIMEQYTYPRTPVIQARFIPRLGFPPLTDGSYQNASNNADAFYVIR